ncbi:hypothetical protein [Bradyrhizobium sp.]|jgi:hypothetical protein|uniref:hypothetical protein n=1 Tax=Bradyrhizobium sp. TaxID=376 RepID=UPI003C78CF42
MPLARYFLVIGGVLLALLFVVDAVLPSLPVADKTDAAVDMPVIRINSDRKWPERVVFDTSTSAFTAVPTLKAEAAVPASTVADTSAKARVRDAYAQLQPSDSKPTQLSDARTPEPKLQRKRKIAKSRVSRPTMLVAQQPRFGFFFANNTW